MSLFIEDTHPNPNNEIIGILDELSDPRDDQIAALQEDIENLKNKHQEEKFLWFLGGIAVFDVAVLLRADNWSGPIVIGIIELIAILVMAHRCKVETAAPFIDKVVGSMGNLLAKKKDGDN